MDQEDVNAPPLATLLLDPPFSLGVDCGGSHVEREIPICCFALLSDVVIGVERVRPKPRPEASEADADGLVGDSRSPPGALAPGMAEACILLAPGVRLTLSLLAAEGS